MRRDAKDLNDINQIPVIAIGKEACSNAGENQAGGIILMLGLYFNKAPVFRFFKTEMHKIKSFPPLNKFWASCLIVQAQGAQQEPIWLKSAECESVFSHISGWTGFLIGYFTSRPLKQKSIQTVVSNITARGVMFCEG